MRALSALLAVTLVLAGCGGDDDDMARTVTTTTTTSEPTTTDPPSDDEDDTTTTSEASDSASTDAEGILLTIDDLPSGWSVTPPDEDDEEESDDCFTEAIGFEFDPDAESEFQGGDFGPFVAASVSVYDDDGAAAEDLDAMANGFGACDGDVEVDEDGNETTTRVQPLSFPNLGDDTFASRMTFESGFGSGSGDIVITRVGNVLIFLGHIAIFAGADTQLTEQLQRTMVDRA